MDSSLQNQLQDVALSIRSLSMDAIQKANSGHPGLPLGCAEVGAYLYGEVLNYNPAEPNWLNRDRFVLSAGHGSMFLYSLLHLSGYDLSLDEIKNFRQLHSITPGHPEVFETPGVEMTTGPLGQGLAVSVGMALSGKILGAKFNRDGYEVFNHKVYTLAGDGCIMEGIAHEASSFAGHLGLDNLVVLYDANDISLDGDLDECFSEDVGKRYEAYGFDVKQIDGHSLDELESGLTWADQKNGKPKLLICKTTIGQGSPNKAGTSSVHGSPLGSDEIKLTKENLGLDPDKEFHIGEGVPTYFEGVQARNQKSYDNWCETFQVWQEKYPELDKTLQKMLNEPAGLDLAALEKELPEFQPGDTLAGRKSSQACIQVLGEKMESLIGGSADLSCSDSTEIKGKGFIERGEYDRPNIKYGVREFAMSAIGSGLALSGAFTPFVGTFLTFSDYLRPSLRLASLIGLRVIYQFTHDSVFLGEDGPTHQSVEHAAALRAIPGAHVLRPADGNEARGAWLSALEHSGPTAILLSRQNVPHLAETGVGFREGVARGAYEVYRSGGGEVSRVIYSSGTELHLALEVAKELAAKGESVRVISVPCVELFEKQDAAYKDDILTKSASNRHAIEAQVSFGWHRFVGYDGTVHGVDRYGVSAPLKDVQDYFGFTVSKLLEAIQSS